MTPEKRIEYEILSFLRSIGIWCWKNDRQGTYDPVRKVFRKNNNPYKIKGVSDILGVIQGRMLAIEVKAPKGVIRPEQRVFIARINEEGGIAFVARSLEQAASQLLSHFPNNEKLKRFTEDYIKSRGADH